ncbi:diguanylate cyclase [Sphaerotilus hippei]|uniref:diguanylate cyclase n=1 Tax=Sphaerotilus hippei TaxID=744406 RepID=A0A318H8V1_9BURK|nr:GGDEF domain-containing protein [Sphaerotilus hippei]PXW94538.1 diguanylate cyclase [Sphaerotilus hippei]
MFSHLDVHTLLVVFTVNLIAVALALPLLMGLKVSAAARRAQWSMGLQAVGWVCLIASSRWAGTVFDLLLSTASMAALSASLVLLWKALQRWISPRDGHWTMWSLAVLMPLAYALGFEHYAFRVGIANAVLALQMGLLCVELLRPTEQASWRWRALLALAMALQSVVTSWRGVLGAFFTSAYPHFESPHPVNIAAALVSNLTLLLVAASLLMAYREEAERQLRALAITDGLTGLLNRRAWSERAAALLADARRYGHPLIVLMLDLDHFKVVNDQHGHAKGDAALMLVARLLREQLRTGDLAARYGGEEFCLLLSHTREGAAIALDQRLRQTLRRVSTEELGFPIDYSAGLAAFHADHQTLDDMLRRADHALYEAKHAGRGQLVIAP